MIIGRPARITLLVVAALIVVFVVTWVAIPAGTFETRNLTTGRWETPRVAYPAKLFRPGLRTRVRECRAGTTGSECPGAEIVRLRTDLGALRSRVLVVFGAAAAAVALIGVAFGALRGY